jgi:hypothetical protein
MKSSVSWGTLAVGLPLFAAPLACDKAAASGAATADIVQAAAPLGHVDGNNYKVDTSVGDCAAGAECTGTIRLEALGAYHINDTYPYKFTVFGPDAGSATSSGLELLGKDPNNRGVFGKNTGEFEKQGEKVAVVTVRFKAPKGPVAFAGRFKMSVCSEANCQLEQADLRFEGTAK